MTSAMSYGERLGYMKLSQTTAALRAVLARSTSGLPRAVRVAVDSTSCKTPLSRITTVAEIRDGRVKRRVLVRVVNCKFHIAVDIATRMVLAVIVTDDNVNDVSVFRALLEMIPRRFAMETVYADKGYYSIDNYRLVRDEYSAEPFIDFPDDVKPVGDDRALEAYKAKLGRNDESKPRAAVECLNSMFKRTQKPFLRAKDAQQRECEAVAMMAYHNFLRSVVLHRTAGLPIPYANERAMAVIRGEDVDG